MKRTPSLRMMAQGYLETVRGLLTRRPSFPRAPLAIIHVLLSAVMYLRLILLELRRIRKILDQRLPGTTTSIGLKATPTPKEDSTP